MRKSQAEINAWISSKMAALGIDCPSTNGVRTPTVTTVIVPLMVPQLQAIHAAADAKIAADPRYAAMCERLDTELAAILEGGSESLSPLPRSKHSRKSGIGPRVMTND